MELENLSILASDGLELNVWKWEVENPSKVLCIVHGLGEHGGRYIELAEKVSSAGISVFALDHRGHGESQGKRGHTPSLLQSISDVEELLKTARHFNNDAPLVLFGHSMGGNIVANYMHSMNTNEVSGFILSAPWFRLYAEPTEWKVQLGRLMNGLWPSFPQSNDLQPDLLSRDTIICEDYINDPLVHNKITPRLYFEITNGGTQGIEKASKIRTPGLVYHGNDDRLIDVEGSRAFADKAVEVIEWWEIDGAMHEPHNDLVKERVISKVIDWVLTVKPKEIK